jgi:ketosteroid isomerase-like protein
VIIHQLALLGAAAAMEPTACPPDGSDQPLKEIIGADNSTNVDRVIGLYSDDPIWIPPSAPPLRGLASLRKSYTDMYAEFDPHLTITTGRVTIGAGVATVTGRTSGFLNRRDKSGRKDVHDNFEAVVVCDHGKWRVASLRWWPQK